MIRVGQVWLATGMLWLVVAGAAPAHAQSYMDAGVFKLKSYVQAADCDGAGRNCDLRHAFETAIANCNSLRTQDPDGGARGCVFLVPEGKHRLSTTVDLCRAHVIRGEGFWGNNAATSIWADTTAFVMRGPTYCTQHGLGPGGAGSHIIGMALWASNAAHGSSTANIGIKMESGGLGQIENVSVTQFVVGVRIVAADPARNATPFALFNVDASSNRFAGVWVRGNDNDLDAHAGSTYHVNANSNCSQGDYWKSQSIDGDAVQGFCAAIIDKSYVGNTWVGTQVSYTEDEGSHTLYPGFVFDKDGFQDSTCLGCYAEGNSYGLMGYRSMALGGSSDWQTNYDGYVHGFRLRGGSANALVINNALDPNNTIEFAIGTGAGIGFRMTSLANGTPKSELSLQYNVTNKAFQFHVDNLGSVGSLNFVGEQGSPLGPSIGQLYFAAPFIANPCVFQQSCQP